MSGPGTHAAPPALPALSVSAPETTLLKWIALVAMTLDHVDQYLFDSHLGLASTVGRLAMPLFAFVLAHNLVARGFDPARCARTIGRLLMWGTLAMVPWIALNGWRAPLNILFSLAACAGLAWAWRQAGFSRAPLLGRALVLLGVLVMGALIDYQWFVIGLFAALCAWCIRPTPARAAWVLVALALLRPFHDSDWPLLAALIVVASGSLVRWAPALGRLPRGQRFFYAYYAGHLAVLAALAALAAAMR